MELAPRISVCIPTHNRPGFLRQAVASVLASTENNFEIIISDDADSEDTREVVRHLADPRIRYLKHDVSDIASNWSNAVRNARAEYVFKLDDDDTISPEFLEECCHYLDRHAEVAIVFTGFTWHEVGGSAGQRIDTDYFKTSVVDGLTYAEDLLLNRAYPLNHKSAGVFRYAAAAAIGFFDIVKVDLLFTVAVAATGAVGYIPKPLFRYQIHGGLREGMGERPMTMLFEGFRNLFEIPIIETHPEWMRVRSPARKTFVRGGAIRYVGDAFFRQGYRAGWRMAGSACQAEPSLKRSPFFWAAVLGLSVIPKSLYLRILNFYIKTSWPKRALSALLRF